MRLPTLPCHRIGGTAFAVIHRVECCLERRSDTGISGYKVTEARPSPVPVLRRPNDRQYHAVEEQAHDA